MHIIPLSFFSRPFFFFEGKRKIEREMYDSPILSSTYDSTITFLDRFQQTSSKPAIAAIYSFQKNITRQMEQYYEDAYTRR
jgi:hypothetical protein